jgi:hypothetical protein
LIKRQHQLPLQNAILLSGYAAGCDARRYPSLNLAFDPPNSTGTEFYALRKAALCLQFVNEGAAKPSHFANLRQA